MRIQRANLRDCEQVYELCKIPGLLNPSGEPPKIWWIESFVKEKQMFFVMKEKELSKDGKSMKPAAKEAVIGFILGERTTGDIGYIWMLAVKEDFQGKGIGKELMKKFEYECKKNKIKVIVCYGFEKSSSALSLLNNMDYEIGRKYYEFVKFLK